MLSLFRNKKIVKAIQENEAQERIARTIVHTIINWQKRLANRMQKGTEKLSGRVQLIMLLLFCVISGGYNIYLLCSKSLGKQFFSNSITAAKKLTYSNKSGDENTRSSNIINKEEYQRILLFKKYMDSLLNSPQGKIRRDSILAIRPRLMDSILIIEKIYLSQTKK